MCILVCVCVYLNVHACASACVFLLITVCYHHAMFENNLIFTIQENIHEKYIQMHETCPLLPMKTNQHRQLHYVHVFTELGT